MTLVGQLRKHIYQREIERKQAFYAQARTPSEVQAWQLARFNQQWQMTQRNVPFYRREVAEKRIPTFFDSWDVFRETMPVLTREMIEAHYQDLKDETRKPDFASSTSGTTSKALTFYHWNSERQMRVYDRWVGRGWHGITPADSCFLIWGMTSTVNNGQRFAWSVWQRKQLDRLLGYQRFHAYNVSAARTRKAVDEMLRMKPEYVVGYSVFLDLVARENEDRKAALHGLKLKAVIASSECLPFKDSAEKITEVFGAPLVMEYGAEELDVIAYQDKNGKYRVFWENLMLETVDQEDTAMKKLLVTSLYPRYFPLIRYDIGDNVELLPEQEERCCLTTFQYLDGRMADYLTLPDGSRIDPWYFSAVVKGVDHINAYQVVEFHDHLELHLLMKEEDLTPSLVRALRSEISSVHPLLKGIIIKAVHQLYQTPRGKTPRIHRIHIQDEDAGVLVWE